MTSTENYESNARPRETPLTTVQNAFYAADQAKTVERAKARVAAKLAAAPIVLATETETVEFHPSGKTVSVTRKSSVGPWPRYIGPWPRETLSIDHARAEYRRLLSTGYWRW